MNDPWKMSPRRWIAWKLVQLAERIYDSSFMQTITIDSPSGEQYVIDFDANLYGCGISATSGIDFRHQPDDSEVADVEGWTWTWTDE